jgi:hypothetical protein
MTANSISYDDIIDAFNKIPKTSPHGNPIIVYMNELSIPLFGELVNEDRLFVYLSGVPVKFSENIPVGTAIMEMEDKTVRVFRSDKI